MTKQTTGNTPTPAAAARVQSAVASKNGGQVPKGSYAGRIQSAAAKGGKR